MDSKKQNKMGKMPVGKLVFTMSLPLMASLLVQSLYNIVDGIFVARLSEKALTATSLAYPLQILSGCFRRNRCWSKCIDFSAAWSKKT